MEFEPLGIRRRQIHVRLRGHAEVAFQSAAKGGQRLVTKVKAVKDDSRSVIEELVDAKQIDGAVIRNVRPRIDALIRLNDKKRRSRSFVRRKQPVDVFGRKQPGVIARVAALNVNRSLFPDLPEEGLSLEGADQLREIDPISISRMVFCGHEVLLTVVIWGSAVRGSVMGAASVRSATRVWSASIRLGAAPPAPPVAPRP